MSMKWTHLIQPLHIFGDLLDMLPAALRCDIAKRLPLQGLTRDQTQQRIEEIETMVFDQKRAFPPNRLCWCWKHEYVCPLDILVAPLVTDIDSGDEGEIVVSSDEEEIAASAAPGPQRRLTLEVAGTPCIGWIEFYNTGRRHVHQGAAH